MKLISKYAFYAYKILPEQQLIIDYTTGTLNSKDMINAHEILSGDANYNEEFNRLIVLTDTRFKVSYHDINSVVSYHNNTSFLKNKKKVAVVAKTESQMLLATIFIEKLNNLPANLNMFKDIHETCTFLALTDDCPGMLEHLLDDMKQTLAKG